MRNIFTTLICSLTLLFTTAASAEKISVLTYNTWGVGLKVWDTWRYAAAMKAIEELNPDIVILEEVFTAKGRHAFQSPLYPYVADGPGWFPRLISSGVRILSKFPIEQSTTIAYSKCARSDCLSHKGAALVTVTLPSGNKLNVVGTHLNSEGGDDLRVAQLSELKTFIDENEDPTLPMLVAGDFNFGPGTGSYQFVRNEMKLGDSWLENHPAVQPIVDIDDMSQAIRGILESLTYDASKNHYAHDYCVKMNDPQIEDRYDYFYHNGGITPIQSKLVFNTEDTILSDHFGLFADFEL